MVNSPEKRIPHGNVLDFVDIPHHFQSFSPDVKKPGEIKIS